MDKNGKPMKRGNAVQQRLDQFKKDTQIRYGWFFWALSVFVVFYFAVLVYNWHILPLKLTFLAVVTSILPLVIWFVLFREGLKISETKYQKLRELRKYHMDLHEMLVAAQEKGFVSQWDFEQITGHYRDLVADGSLKRQD